MRLLPALFARPRAAAAPRPAHGDVEQVAGRPVRLAVNPRARRIGLRLDASARQVVATAPSRARLPEALAFAHARADWVAARLADLPRARPFRPGGWAPHRGAACRLEPASGRAAARLLPAEADRPARLVAPGEGAAFARAVERVLRRAALERLTQRTAWYAARLGLPAPTVAVADARGRWGSCRPPHAGDAGRIRYSWRLICAPDAVSDYVVAHEVAHLVEPNHGSAFWALTHALYGDIAPARAWLKTHGAALHALGGEPDGPDA